MTYKIIQIREDAHTQIKENAKKWRMSMRDYIEYLLELDEDAQAEYNQEQQTAKRLKRER